MRNINQPATKQLEITIRVEDKQHLNFIDFKFKHTRHSYSRSSQRGLNPSKIKVALQYGENIYKQGLIYYILGEHNIPESLRREKDKLQNTIVVVSGSSNEVVTCYRSSNPFKNIRMKSKRLGTKFYNAA